jgi:hypothetical protein
MDQFRQRPFPPARWVNAGPGFAVPAPPVKKRPLTLAREFLGRVENLKWAITVCEFFDLAHRDITNRLIQFAGRIETAEALVETYENKLKAEQFVRDERRRLKREADEKIHVAVAITKAEKLRHLWMAESNTDLDFGHEFWLLDSRPELKTKMIFLEADRTERELREKIGELHREKWELEAVVGGTLAEIKARREATEQAHRAITLDDQ